MMALWARCRYRALTAADDLTGADTLGLTLDPLLEKVIFKPLLQ